MLKYKDFFLLCPWLRSVVISGNIAVDSSWFSTQPRILKNAVQTMPAITTIKILFTCGDVTFSLLPVPVLSLLGTGCGGGLRVGLEAEEIDLYSPHCQCFAV